MGQVVAFAEIVRMRRQREGRRCHAQCVALIAASVDAARTALRQAPPNERWVWVARVRKLEELAAYASEGGAVA